MVAVRLLVIQVVCASTLSAATPALAGTALFEALAQAYSEHPRLQAARVAQRGVDEQVAIAKGGYRPSLELASRAGLRKLETAAGNEQLQTSRVALALRQPLYSGGGTGAAVAAAESDVLGQRARTIQVEQDVLLDAVEAFTAVIRDQALFELAMATERQLEIEAESVRRQYRFGATTAAEVAQTESRQAAALAIREEALGTLRASGAFYEAAIGSPPGLLEDPPLPMGLPASKPAALAFADIHPVIEAARLDIEVAQQEVGVVRSTMRPRLAIEGDAAYADEPENETSGRQDLSAALSLVIPLYQAGVASARTRAARYEVQRLDQVEQDELRRVRARIDAVWERWQSDQTRLDALRRQEMAARLARDGIETEVKAGTRRIVDLLDAERDLLRAGQLRLEVEREVTAGAYRLMAALGRLTAAELGLPVTLDNPALHYEKTRNRWRGTDLLDEKIQDRGVSVTNR